MGIETYERKNDPTICTLQVRKVPKAVRNAFKARCALLEIDMSDKIVSMIREFLKTSGGSK